jgi:MATE family multidrug resistance protein
MFFQNWPRIAKLAGPSIISFVFTMATGTLSLMILGHHGTLVIAIIGVCNIIGYNCWALFSGISHAVNYLVAQSFGEQKMERGVQRTHIATLISMCIFVFLIVAAYFGSTAILQFIGGEASQEIISGADYLFLRTVALAIGLITFMYHGFFRGVGDTRTPMALTLLGAATTIAFIFILTSPEGLTTAEILIRAGLAFIIGETINFLVTLWFYYVKLNRKYHTRAKFVWEWSDAKLISKESGKLGIQEFSISLSMLIFTIFVARLGEVALAANEIAINIMTIGFMPSFAFATTATILVGHEIGRGNPLLAKRLGMDSAIMGSILIIILGIFEFIFAESLARLFSNDPLVFELAALLIIISAFLQLFDTILNVFSGALRGIGDTTFLLYISFSLSWFVFVPLAYFALFVFDLGSIGAWASLYAFIVFFCIAIVVRFYRTDWLSVKLK